MVTIFTFNIALLNDVTRIIPVEIMNKMPNDVERIKQYFIFEMCVMFIWNVWE